MLQICQNIKQVRDSRGISQQEIADKLGVSRTTYANWENETEPTLTIIKSLADYFKVHYTQIIDGVATDVSFIKEPQKPLSIQDISEALKILSDAVLKFNSDDSDEASLSSEEEGKSPPRRRGRMEKLLGNKGIGSTVKKVNKKDKKV